MRDGLVSGQVESDSNSGSSVVRSRLAKPWRKTKRSLIIIRFCSAALQDKRSVWTCS